MHDKLRDQFDKSIRGNAKNNLDFFEILSDKAEELTRDENLSWVVNYTVTSVTPNFAAFAENNHDFYRVFAAFTFGLLRVLVEDHGLCDKLADNILKNLIPKEMHDKLPKFPKSSSKDYE